jgi:hypothetical protein
MRGLGREHDMDDKAAQKGREEALFLLVESLAAAMDPATFDRFSHIAMAAFLDRTHEYADAVRLGEPGAKDEATSFQNAVIVFGKRVKLAWM